MKFASLIHARIYGYVIAMMTDDEFDNYLTDWCGVGQLLNSENAPKPWK